MTAAGTAGRVLAVVAGAAAVGVAATAASNRKKKEGEHPEGWKSVTVLADESAFAPGGRYPKPLADLADRLEIRIRPASQDRGIEVHARFRPGEQDADAGTLRAALRDAKSLAETGSVLRMHPRPHGRRTPTPGGALIDRAESGAKGAGLL